MTVSLDSGPAARLRFSRRSNSWATLESDPDARPVNVRHRAFLPACRSQAVHQRGKTLTSPEEIAQALRVARAAIQAVQVCYQQCPLPTTHALKLFRMLQELEMIERNVLSPRGTRDVQAATSVKSRMGSRLQRKIRQSHSATAEQVILLEQMQAIQKKQRDTTTE